MALDMTTFASALKVHYTDDMVENMCYMDNPLYALLPKMTTFGGKNLPIPIIFGNPQGQSSNFATAQSNKTNSTIKDFVLTRNHYYSLASIDNETIEASKGNSEAFMEAATTEIDGAIATAARSLSIQVYGSGSGTVGQLAASTVVSSPLIQLARIEDVTNFEIGQKYQTSATDGGGAVRSGVVTIAAIDRDLGTLTTSAAMNTGIAAIAVGDYLVLQGNYGTVLKGLAAWLPIVAPTTGDSFFTVDRSLDTSRLAGIRFNGVGAPIEEVVVNAASRLAREGGKPEYCFVSYGKYAELENALGSKVQYVDVKVNPEIGFRGITINGPKGPIKVIPDQNCPSDRAYMLQMNTWKLYSLGKAPKILDTDGLKMLRDSNADSVEIRVGFYAQMGCRAPGWNAVISL